MSWTVWKFPLPLDRDDFELPMPAGVTLSVQAQNGVPCLWAAVMPETAEAGKRRPARFVWVGTGRPLPEAVKNITQSYVGTVQLFEGRLVLHLFRVWR